MNRVTQNPWAIVLVALLPVLVLGILLAALWNPMDRLDTVPAAIVNNDEPVEVDGQTAPLGRQLAAGLVEGAEDSDVNYDWTLTDAEHATDGLADGTYAAVVTIPEGFSAAATSFGAEDADDARQATIDIATPPGGRVVDVALARVVATTATSVMGSMLTETYVDNVLIGFNDLSEGIGEAADGAGELASGAGDAAAGATELSDGAGQLADGAGEYAAGVGEAASGADDLAGGADQLADGVAGLADGAQPLADGAKQVADGAEGVARGARESAAGAGDLADGAGDLADGAGDLAGGAGELAANLQKLDTQVEPLPGGIAQAAGGVDEISSGLGAYVAEMQKVYGCGDVPESPQCQSLAPLLEIQAGAGELASELTAQVGSPASEGSDPTGLYALAAGIDGLSTGATQLAGGADELAEGADQVATGTQGLADGLDELASGAGQVSTGADGVADGVSGLADGVSRLDTGAHGLSTGVSQFAAGVDRLDAGAQELATGTDGLADGASGLADGVGQLASGTDDLAGGLDEAAAGIPTYTDGERRNLASVVANPVAAPGVDDLSTGATGPLFAVVALWLGALGLLTIFPPVAARALGSTRPALRLALGALTVPAAVGAGTGAAVGAILAGVEGLSPLGWVGTILLGALVSVSFVAVHVGFLAWLGNLGRGVSLLIAVLMIGTGVVATVPDVLVSVADVLPTGAGRDALAAAVVPAVGGLGGALTWVVLWTLVGLGLGIGATARARRTRVAALLRA
ncbi:YhgE/Pip domain-containing protein [Isoptericola croceus]|uniref:YhgE/Pip domain-containing protein n=1 Tax=Isoptericola croceus TaxID=3031406 RepID=UPI0023F736F9|nr:YhgE/Pip domain-containing protein [Isoptericola croceus]